jgi:chromosome partitioning protein
MAKILGVLGEKGGSGKSSLAHLAAHGFGSLPRSIDAVVVVTDPLDEVYQHPRRYYVADARDHSKLPALLKKLNERDDLVVIVDGAAGRVAIDEALNKVADLIIVPFTAAYHDAVRAVRHLERLPGGLAVPNRWPTHPGSKAHANKLLDLFPRDRTMDPIPQIGKITDLLNPTEYGRAATSLSRPGQSFCLEVLYRMKTHPFDLKKKA